MKALLLCFGLLAVAAWAVDIEKPVPAIRLADGRVLKNAVFTRFSVQTVTMQSQLGTVVVKYEALPDDVRSEAERKRPGGPRWFPGDTTGNTETVSGQVFVVTRGNSTYKFGNVSVYAFDLHALDLFDITKDTVRLPKPIHLTHTDADGKFALKVPVDRPYFIFAQASRLVPEGISTATERFEWRIPMSAVRAGKQLNLSQDNSLPARQVEIELQP